MLQNNVTLKLNRIILQQLLCLPIDTVYTMLVYIWLHTLNTAYIVTVIKFLFF